MISLPKGVNLSDLIHFLRNIGLQSSAVLRSFENDSISLYDFPKNLRHNLINHEPVTAADLALNKLILDEFFNKYPNINWGIITEENSKLTAYQESKNDWNWFIDPLDGTKDFIQKTGEYAVHIALVFKKNPVMSMVLLPSLEEIWFGVLGLGTWKENEKEILKNKEVDLKEKEFLIIPKNASLSVVTSKNHNNQKLELILKDMNFEKIIKMGSIGFKVCSLLRREADIYISISGKTSPKDWDLAAPHALLKGAQCFFTYVNGDEITYDQKNYEQKGCLVASTLKKSEHLSICKKINLVIQKYNF